jgi:hypothetical protein
MSPYLDYEFVAVFKIRQDSYIYIYIYIYIVWPTWQYLEKKKKSECDECFFCIFPLKFANFFSENLRIMCQNILTLLFFWRNFHCNLPAEKYQSGPRRKGNSTGEVSQRMDGWMDVCGQWGKCAANWQGRWVWHAFQLTDLEWEFNGAQ